MWCHVCCLPPTHQSEKGGQGGKIMAGVVPGNNSGRKTARKQWTLHGHQVKADDGPRGSLRRLRGQLAEDGCPESQVVLAKQLLQDQTDLDNESDENGRLAIYWLIKASEQGSLEASDLLRTCLETGRGVTVQNQVDIQACLAMSQPEKVARRAARDLFSSLADGGDFITSGQLRDKIRECSGLDGCPAVGGMEKITEAHLVHSASMYTHGHLPPLHGMLALDEPSTEESIVERTVFHPWKAVKSLYRKSVEVLAKHGASVVAIPTSQLKTLALLATYTLLGPERLLVLVPLVAYYISYAGMALVTFKILYRRREHESFQMWSELFRKYAELEPEVAESEFGRRDVKSYIWYAVCLAIHLMARTYIAETWIPREEMAVVSLAMAILVLLGCRDIFALAVVGLNMAVRATGHNMVASLPHIDMSEYAYVVKSHWCHLEVTPQSIAALLVPVAILKIAGRQPVQALSFSLGIAWLQLAGSLLEASETTGIIRGTIALVSVLLVVPAIGLLLLLLPAVAVGRYLLDVGIAIQVGATVALVSILVGCTIWARRRIPSVVMTTMQVALGIAAVVTVIPALDWSIPPESQSVTWTEYQQQCHEPAWKQSSIAQVQLNCVKFADTTVQWDAHVSSVRVRKRDNPIETIVGHMPYPLDYYASCLANEHCQLSGWDRITFEIHVLLKEGLWQQEVAATLIAPHGFKDFALRLRTGDHIEFSGRLAPGLTLGGGNPEINLQEAYCVACKDRQLRGFKTPKVMGLFQEVLLGLKSIANFALYPLIRLQ